MVNYGIKDHIRRKVSLVVAAIDDFSNTPILGRNIKVSVSGENPPVCKEEGYFVFVNLKREQVVLCLEGGLFQKQVLQLDLSEEKEGYTFFKVRMMPNRSYPIPRDTTCIEGKAEMGSLIRVVCEASAKPFKLLYEYKKEKNQPNAAIRIFHSEDVDIEGKDLFIKNNESGDSEFLHILAVKDAENKEYLLSEALSRSYKKIGTTIYPVYTTTADRNGEFFLPIPKMYEEESEYLLEAIGKETIRKVCKLAAGRINLVDLTKEDD